MNAGSRRLALSIPAVEAYDLDGAEPPILFSEEVLVCIAAGAVVLTALILVKTLAEVVVAFDLVLLANAVETEDGCLWCQSTLDTYDLLHFRLDQTFQLLTVFLLTLALFEVLVRLFNFSGKLDDPLTILLVLLFQVELLRLQVWHLVISRMMRIIGVLVGKLIFASLFFGLGQLL